MTIKEAAKEILKAHCSSCYTRECKVCAYNTALLAMLHPSDNWTPCSVALPEKGVYVLGYLRTKEMKNDPMFIICKYDESEDDDCFFDRDGWREDIIAWQPLPEPYRGEVE